MSHSARWQNAASMYEADRRAKAVARKPAPPPVAIITNRGPSPEIIRAARELEQFLVSSEGKAALDLLSQSGEHITLYAENEGGGIVSVTYLDGTGLFDGAEAKRGEAMFYMSKLEQREHVAKDSFRPASALTAVENAYLPRGGFARGTNNDPTKFMQWLYGKIDEIAARAPETSAAA